MKLKISILIFYCAIQCFVHTSQNEARKKIIMVSIEKQKFLEAINTTQVLLPDLWQIVADYLTCFAPSAPWPNSKSTPFVNAQAIGPYVACADNEDDIHLWDTHRKILVHQFKGHTGSILPLTDLLHGRLASGSADKTVRIWDIPTRSCIRILKGHDSGIIGLAAHDNLLVAFTQKHRARLWNIDTGQCLRDFVYSSTTVCFSAVFTPKGLLISNQHGNIIKRTFDLSKDSITQKPTIYIESRCKRLIHALKLSPGGKLALSHVNLTGGTSPIEIWDSNAKYLQTIRIDVDKDDYKNRMQSIISDQKELQAIMTRAAAMTWISEDEIACLDITERLLIFSAITGEILQKFKFLKKLTPIGLAYVGNHLVVSTTNGQLIICNRKINVTMPHKNQ